MGKGDDKYARKKGSNKQKETFKKYGKHTARGIRHLEAVKEKTIQTQKIEKIEN